MNDYCEIMREAEESQIERFVSTWIDEKFADEAFLKWAAEEEGINWEDVKFRFFPREHAFIRDEQHLADPYLVTTPSFQRHKVICYPDILKIPDMLKTQRHWALKRGNKLFNASGYPLTDKDLISCSLYQQARNVLDRYDGICFIEFVDSKSFNPSYLSRNGVPCKPSESDAALSAKEQIKAVAKQVDDNYDYEHLMGREEDVVYATPGVLV